MTQLNDALSQISALTVYSANARKIKKCVFSKPQDTDIQKAVLTLKCSKNQLILQLETFHKDNKATHKNIPLDENSAAELTVIGGEYSQINLITLDGECEYKCSKSGRSVLLGADKLKAKMESNTNISEVISSNNRKKEYILDGSEEFLKYLDVSDKNGRVYDKRQAKFRQINRFLELIRDVEDKLPHGEICICDLCCGKSYLSFAAYHYFANVKRYSVSMTGVDLKADVVEKCNSAARDLNFNGLNFVCMDVNQFTPDKLPSLVISLHACDFATDFVLNKATEWKADVILSTPCCHHELNHNIDCPELSFITDYSMLRQKLCDAATDALRLLRLEAEGYSVAALELIDPEETPKNVMLRAIRKKKFDPSSHEAIEAREKYIKAREFLCGRNSDKNLHF